MKQMTLGAALMFFGMVLGNQIGTKTAYLRGVEATTRYLTG